MSRKFISITAISLCAILLGGPLLGIAAAAENSTPQAKISFTFDDGLASSVKLAAPILKSRGLTGTNYVPTHCIGMTKTPNTCRADRDKPYMSWAQVKSLQDNFGWEIGSHTATHPLLASTDPIDGQPNPLTLTQIRTELTSSKSALTNHGLRVNSFASPYGDYNSRVLAEVAKVYANHRGFADTGMNDWPYNEYLLYDQPMTSAVSATAVKTKIDEAIAGKKWLVLTFHDVVGVGREGMRPANPSPGRHTYSYDYSTANLALIADYVAQKQSSGLIRNLNPGSAMVTGTSVLPNGSFVNGIKAGWTTDAPTSITANRANAGSYPSPVDSVRLVSAGGADKHLFGPRVTVNPSTTYALKMYLNVANRSSGYVGIYVDEYDLSGNWISGQFKAEERTKFAENLNSIYKPNSANVAAMRLQVYIGGGTLTAFVDNAQLIPLSSAPLVNLMPNPQFDDGLGGGWSTDSSRVAADTANHGSPAGAQNAISMLGSTTETHLFSPRITVSSTSAYTVSSYLDIKNNGGDTFGYYIDEYNAGGEWVSGQYKLSVASGATDRTFNYTPSSSIVTSASLQVIIPARAAAAAYFDWVRWYQN